MKRLSDNVLGTQTVSIVLSSGDSSCSAGPDRHTPISPQRPERLHLRSRKDVCRSPAGQQPRRHMTTVENGIVLQRYWDLASCTAFALKPQCTTGEEWRVTRWERERVIEAMQERMDRAPKMQVRRATVEHPFRTLKARMGSTRFLTKTLAKVRTEMSLRLRLQREKTDQHPRHQTADERYQSLIAAPHLHLVSTNEHGKNHDLRRAIAPSSQTRFSTASVKNGSWRRVSAPSQADRQYRFSRAGE